MLLRTMDRVGVVTKAAWTRDNLRHGAAMIRYGRHPAATVYDSIGEDFFIALAPGWLNLGLWDGDGGDPAEAPVAVRRLVETLAHELPKGGDVLDVGNGLAAQDPVIADVAGTQRLVALNITRSQLVAGRQRLADAGAQPVNGDATRLPFVAGSFDGVISVEAAFHFSSRARFFSETFRVLRPGGVLSMSDIPTYRYPQGPRELVAALSQLRVWGLGTHAAATPVEIVRQVEQAGFVDVRTELVGERVIAPALRFVRERLRTSRAEATGSYRLAASIMLSQVELLWHRGMIDYLLLAATKPSAESRVR
jgi:cyclopropane fatty-acyl-phospholipid synthase-like methyltransferase